MAQLLGVLEQGLIYAILALGVYITFKILDFPDMTVDSSFPLGAAVTARVRAIYPRLYGPEDAARRAGGRGAGGNHHRRDPCALSRG